MVGRQIVDRWQFKPRQSIIRGGLGNLTENWEDSEELAQELGNILDERT